jgi:hypothetical protein
MTALVPDASVWNFATAPDPVACLSRFVGHPLAAPGAALVCLIDHVETGEVLHGLGFVRWSDEDAAAAVLARTWTCLYCSVPCAPHLFRGCCSSRCTWLEHDASNEYEIEVEA